MLADIARKALQEEAFHLRHADALLDKLLASPQARERLLDALALVRPLAAGLCEAVEGEAEALRQGVCTAATSQLAGALNDAIDGRFGVSEGILAAAGGQHPRTERSSHFEPLMTRMREVLDYDSEAVW